MIAKGSENKFYHYLTIKGIVSDLDAVPNAETSYLDYPREVKLSEDLKFMMIITYKGSVLLIKLPDLPNPFSEEQQE